MLKLTLGQTDEDLIVTLNEKRTLTSGYYLFYFQHVTTRQTVTKIYNFLEDESAYPERFNSFPMVTNTTFSGKPVGHWTYSIYEQASSSNTNPAGLTEVENGILQLKPATPFAFVESTGGSAAFTQYGG